MVRTLVDTVSSQIERLYVDADTATRIANVLRARFKAGAYSQASDETALAELMTRRSALDQSRSAPRRQIRPTRRAGRERRVCPDF